MSVEDFIFCDIKEWQLNLLITNVSQLSPIQQEHPRDEGKKEERKSFMWKLFMDFILTVGRTKQKV